MDTNKAPIVTLIYQQGCGACHEAMPEFRKLAAKHPRLRYRMVDLDTIKNAPFPIPYTPTFHVAFVGGYDVTDASKLDDLTMASMEGWLRGVFARRKGR